MYRKLAAIFGLALTTGLFCPAQDAGETIKVETKLVSVPVVVSDRKGRYVPNLTASDFTLSQDGKPQTIEFFASTEEPLTVALLIDTSHSTRPVLGDIKDSALSFIKLLLPQDRAMIVSFDHDTHILSPLTSDHEQLKNAIKQAEIPEYFGTTLRDAAYETITRTLSPITGRKAVIILTDGKDAGSRISKRELFYSLQETDTLVYTVMFTTDDHRATLFPLPRRRRGGMGGRFPGVGRRYDPRPAERMKRANQEAEEFLQELSEVTAGRSYKSRDGKLKKTFAAIVEELRFQYRLGFYPPDETGGNAWRELRIKVNRPDMVVRARRGYRVQTK